jgi:hypothetical protein
MRYLLYFSICASFIGCTPREDDTSLLAELGSEKLYLADIQDRIPSAGSMDPADSTGYVNLLITDWAKNTLLVQAAEFNLQEDLQNFEDLVTQYRNDLLKHAYIDLYINQNIDTNILKEQVNEYYQANKASFELKERIVKAKYTAAPVGAQRIDEAKRWFSSKRDFDKFLDWAETFATNQSNFQDSTWIPVEDFISKIPMDQSNPYSNFTASKKFTCEDSILVYFVEINDIRFEDSYSPLEYVENRIRKVLLNKRRIKLIERIEENIIEDAIEEGTLIIY